MRPVPVAADCTPAHAAAHIRRRLLPTLARVLAEFEDRPTAPTNPQPAPTTDAAVSLDVVTQNVSAVLDALAPPYVQGSCDGWVIGERVSRRCSLPAVWWQTATGSTVDSQAGRDARSMVPFLADALRRAGLETAEPRHGRWVFFTPPPTAPARPRYTVQASPGYSGHWDVVDGYSGAVIRSSGDHDRAGSFAEDLENEHDVRWELRLASLDLPGIQVGAADEIPLRTVAVSSRARGTSPTAWTAPTTRTCPASWSSTTRTGPASWWCTGCWSPGGAGGRHRSKAGPGARAVSIATLRRMHSA